MTVVWLKKLRQLSLHFRGKQNSSLRRPLKRRTLFWWSLYQDISHLCLRKQHKRWLREDTQFLLVVTELSASEGGREAKANVSARGLTLMSGGGRCHSGAVRGKVSFS